MGRQRKSQSSRRRGFALHRGLHVPHSKPLAPASKNLQPNHLLTTGEKSNLSSSPGATLPLTPTIRSAGSPLAASPQKTQDSTHQKIEAVLQGVLDKRRSQTPRPFSNKSSDGSSLRHFRGSRQLQYHHESQRPWVCWLFVLPLILFYESVTISSHGQAGRSGLDQWIGHFLNWFGLGQLVILPLVTTGVLLLAHHRRQDHWNFNATVLGWMLVESLGLGLILFWAANAVYLSSQSGTIAFHSITNAWWEGWPQTIAVIGSGIYEELIFRLILLTLTIQCILRFTGIRPAHWVAIAIISLVFASLHYDFVNPAGGVFEISSFLFRLMASVVFSLLFLFRGFGIAVGTHVAFDVFTQI
jgi:membrane protease YdiL (CAAX protease family)